MTGSAIFSECGLYRYRLSRDLGRQGPIVCMIGVNPSDADAEKNDATIRKDIGFGDRNGWGKLVKVNLCAAVSTDVRRLARMTDPVGPDNNDHLKAEMLCADFVIACWGPPTKLPMRLRNRWREVLRLAELNGVLLHCIGTTNEGHPRHPLMTPYNTPVTPWKGPL